MGLIGILIALGLLIWLAYRGWSILLLAPAAAILAAALAGEPLLAHWTQTFMASAAQFVMQFFPIFLLGALFGKLMEDSGSVASIAKAMTERLGPQRAVLAVVLAGAIVTYGGVSLFVAFFVLAPMAHQLFRAAAIPRRLMPAAIALGTTTFTMSALPGTPAIQNAIPMPFFGTTPFAAPGLGFIAAIVMFGFGMWWLGRAEKKARAKGEGYGADVPEGNAAEDLVVRERATTASTFDPPEAMHGRPSDVGPPIALAALPLVIVVAVNLLMSLFVLPRMDASFLEKVEWGETSLAAVGGVWAVVTALFVAIVVLIAINYRRLPRLRDSMDAGANASVLPVLSVASLVGFGSVVAALPAFGIVRDWVLGIEGGPLVSLAVATNVLASLTGSASGGLTIALDALGATYLKIAQEQGINPGLLHRVAVIGAGTLDSLPHNGAVVTLLAVCNSTHRESYLDIVMVSIVGGLLALAVVIILGTHGRVFLRRVAPPPRLRSSPSRQDARLAGERIAHCAWCDAHCCPKGSHEMGGGREAYLVRHLADRNPRDTQERDGALHAAANEVFVRRAAGMLAERAHEVGDAEADSVGHLGECGRTGFVQRGLDDPFHAAERGRRETAAKQRRWGLDPVPPLGGMAFNSASQRAQILFHHQLIVRPAPSAADQDPHDHGPHPVVAQVEHGRASEGRVDRLLGIGLIQEDLDNVRLAAHFYGRALHGREDRDAAALRLTGRLAAAAVARIPRVDEAHRQPDRI